ncbi:MAG: Unknown protein [uncultured Sulfurovum sp.]|uniref:Pilus assembly protein PilO n=1 Tax=uncultured Sulfurovum sp. TaxID=269237 RepID=A0A6S6UDI2_9BACT|nr:MAG: Unknown protein [uncultured Sulfurovum sp.]
MKIIVNILNSLDDYFEVKSDNEKWMMIAMLAVVIGYVSYTFFYPFAEDKFNKEQRKSEALQKKIHASQQYLQSITVGGNRNFYVQKYNTDIKNLEKSIDKANVDITFISTKLEELSPLLFNKESWSKFLNSVTKQAKQQNVNLNYIENNYVDNDGSFGHVLQIEVGCSGQYREIVKFVNQLEKSVLVTDVYGSHLYLDKNDTVVSADINISVWGVNN